MTNTIDIGSLSLAYLSEQYRRGLALKDVLETIFERTVARGDDGIWTHVLSKDDLFRRAAELEKIEPASRSLLWGIPFSVKDCIDVANLPTSCGCPGFSDVASRTNPAVQKLLDAGAILIGKTNLDQFATGLVGIRTGFTIPQNSLVAGYIPGGSSSGAALSVAAGLVSFAIGTDTGGSGRVPAGFNNIVGLKPTRGLLSTAHIVDACKTIDCISIFALTADDTLKVMQVAKGYVPDDPFSRDEAPHVLKSYYTGQAFRFGVPRANQRSFFGNAEAEIRFDQAVERLIAMGGTGIEIDYELFLEANQLLFNGPWLAERYASVGAFIEAHPQQVLPITREIILAGKALTAADAFAGFYRLAALKRAVRSLWEQIDVLVVPTTGTAYRIDEVESNPLELNANLGYYTNFVNLLDLAALAVPNGFQSNGMPAGVTLIAPPYSETYLTGIGSAFHRHQGNRLGATPFSFANIETIHAK